ncbi:uncharacterized protein METZ01_LOCUS129399, partial [marine metagenome]
WCYFTIVFLMMNGYGEIKVAINLWRAIN